MSNSDWKKANLQYDPETNTVILDITTAEVIPAYLRYLLISYGIPSNATIKFKDMTVLIKATNKDDYIYERIED